MSGESRSAGILGAHRILAELLCVSRSRNSLAATPSRSDFIYTEMVARRRFEFYLHRDGCMGKKSWRHGVRTHDVRIRTRFLDHWVKWVPVWKWSQLGVARSDFIYTKKIFFNGGDVHENRHFIEGKLVAHRQFLVGTLVGGNIFQWGRCWWKSSFYWRKISRTSTISYRLEDIMVKIRGEIRKFGNDAWQARVLGKTVLR